MNSKYLVALCATIFSTSLLASEPSAFGAGNLDNPTPYGLTSSEKVVLQNKKNLHKISVKSNNQANEVDSIRERIDGLQGIIESISRKSQENKKSINQLNNTNEESSESSAEYEKRLSNVIQNNSTSIADLNSSLEQLRTEISLIKSNIDSINSDYVTKDEYNSLVNSVNDFKNLVAKEFKRGTKSKSKKSSSSKYSKMSNSQVAKLAQVNFKKRYFTKAIEQYKHLISKGYKPAKAYYLLGEMNFVRKKYADSIAYYKKSTSLYPKASYMPNLMLHTAISMKNTGDSKNAQSFFNGIIANFPDSDEALKAQEYLN